jgi:amino acid adenylation domain-containing protein/thioester reductase-like protein
MIAQPPPRKLLRLSAERRALAEALLKERAPETRKITRTGESGPAPLSFAQERLWFVHQLQPDSPAYNITIPFRISGSLQPGLLDRCLRAVRARHEILRTTFPVVTGEPVQMVQSEADSPGPLVQELDLRSFSPAEREKEAQKYIAGECRRPFDLARGPLFRAALLRLDEAEHVGIVSLHHIVSDGWSTGVFFNDLTAFARALSDHTPVRLPDLPIQYADYARWQRRWLQGEVLERQLAYWKQALDGAPPFVDLPLDHPRPAAQTFRGGRETIVLPSSLARTLREFSEREGATLFMTLLASFNMLLARYSGGSDIVTGTPIANRNRRELESLVGLVMNVLAVRTKLEGDPSFREIVARVRSSALCAYDHQDMPFERLIGELRPDRSSSHPPLVQVMFVLQNAPAAALVIPGADLRPMEAPGTTAKVDLTMYVEENGDALAASLEYNADLFEEATVQRILRGWRVLLEEAVASPEKRLSELSVLDDADRHLLLREWNATASEFPSGAVVHALFEQQAARTPDAVAVRFNGVDCSYAELNRRANKLARYLCERSAGPGMLAGVCMERSIDMVVAVLAVLKTGAAYVPIDPAYPPDRIALVLEDARTCLLVTQAPLLARLPQMEAGVVCVDEEAAQIAAHDSGNPGTAVHPDDLAYVIYTSGSTGKPKGVQVLHRGVVNFLWSMMREPGLAAGDTIAAVTTLSFDIAGLELFLPLIIGARIVLVDAETARDGIALSNLLATSGVTCMQATPATWRMLIEAGWNGDPALKILCGGEALPGDLADALLQRCGSLWNMYGPTETTVWSTVCPVGNSPRPVTIGKPIANTQIYILDRRMNPVPPGVTGTLYIGGEGVARGYLNRPDLTAERFVPDPFGPSGARMYNTGDLARYKYDGTVDFLGRADYQVKIRGHRIELGEIEEVLVKHPSVRCAAVATFERTPGDKQLGAWVVLSEENAPTAADMREFLRRHLPDYMVPAAFVPLPSMPLTPNGKIDRKALPAPPAGEMDCAAEFQPPATGTEKAIARIFEDVLHVGWISRTDNFFELGGHSLLITRVLLRVRDELGIDVAVRVLFENPTVAGLASWIDAGATVETPIESNPEADLMLDGDIVPGWSDPSGNAAFGHVFLTGASGFLGAFLLYELLSRTGAVVSCLVRASDERDAARRIHDKLASYGLWRSEFEVRIIGVPGDLSKPLLGLSPDRFDELANSSDAIYHNGASVNFLSPYSELRASNVLGTQEVLRLASRGRRKPVHYVSTISVCSPGSNAERIREDEPLGDWRRLSTGYAQSKWAAEKLVQIAGARGIPVTVYRPGTITGHTETGACNEADFLYRFIRGCVEMGSAPDIDMTVDIMPVDYAAAALVELSRRHDCNGRVFHLTSDTPTHLSDVCGWVASAGFELAVRPYSEWREQLEELCRNGDTPLAPLAAFFPRLPSIERLSVPQVSYDCANTLRALDGAGVSCRKADGKLMAAYLGYLIKTGVLTDPQEPYVRRQAC